MSGTSHASQPGRQFTGIPRQFGKYRLLYRLAHGGMASVYLGQFTGTDGFRKLVALKIIHEHLSEHRNFIEMFIDEAQLVSRISHPNVVQVYELGSVNGLHYMAMEYVHGESLSWLLRRTDVPVPVCARVISDAASGLHASHELLSHEQQPLQVVHRDVSPNNILVAYDGAVKLIDFGVAKAEGSGHVSKAGSLKGKYAYMSPEQLRFEPLDRRSDVFSLGVVLFEATTRRRLFVGESERDTIRHVLDRPIPCPDTLREDYPAQLTAIVLKALARDRDERYQTADALHEALEHFIISGGKPVLSRDVARLMHSTSAERIAEKARLKREAQAELDTLGPGVSLKTHVRREETASNYTGEPRSTRGSSWTMLVLGLIAAMVLVALYLGLARRPSRPPASAGTGTTSGGMASRARTDATTRTIPPGQPDLDRRQGAVTIEIHATPKSATVLFDGGEVPNPFVVRRRARSGQATVIVRARGHRTRRLQVDLGRDSRWEIALAALPDRPGQKGTSPPGKAQRPTEGVPTQQDEPKRLGPPPKRRLFEDPYQ